MRISSDLTDVPDEPLMIHTIVAIVTVYLGALIAIGSLVTSHGIDRIIGHRRFWVMLLLRLKIKPLLVSLKQFLFSLHL